MEIRISEEDKAAIEQRASERKLTTAEYIVRVGLARAMRQRADVDAINQLRECADQLKAIHAAISSLGQGQQIVIEPGLMNAQMKAITSAIERVWVNGGSNDR